MIWVFKPCKIKISRNTLVKFKIANAKKAKINCVLICMRKGFIDEL